MNRIIREAALKDAEAISDLSRQLGYNTTAAGTADRLKAILENKTHCAFVAVAPEGRVAGWIHGFCALRLESEPFVEIGGLVVHKNHRGAGVGSQLIQQVIVWSTQQLIYRIRVRTNTARLVTHQFYQKLGFTETKEQKVYDLQLLSTSGI